MFAPRPNFTGLAWTLVRTDFRTRYHGTVGGYIWALLKPFTMFVVLLAVFSFVFAGDPLYKLRLIVGLFIFDFFAEGTRNGILALHNKGYLLNKARFPIWIVVLASLANALITFVIFSAVVLAFLGLTRGLPSATSLAIFIAYALALVSMVVGISLAGSALFLRYRDINQVWDVVVQAGFFAAPVIYPLSIIPERFHSYMYLWPPTPIIEFARAVLLGGPPPTALAHALLAAMTFSILAAGIAIYARLSPRSAEYL